MEFYEVRVEAIFAITHRRKVWGKYKNGCALTGFYTTEYVKAGDIESAEKQAINNTKEWTEKLIQLENLKYVVRQINNISYNDTLYTSKALHDKSEILRIQVTNVLSKRAKMLMAEEVLKRFPVSEIAEEVKRLLDKKVIAGGNE